MKRCLVPKLKLMPVNASRPFSLRREHVPDGNDVDLHQRHDVLSDAGHAAGNASGHPSSSSGAANLPIP